MMSRSKTKLPIRGRKKKLPLRGKRGRRLQLLREFEVGRIYTFPEFWRLDFPRPDEYMLDEEKTRDHC